MKILIAGYGSIGRRHLNNLQQLGETDVVLLRSNHSTLSDEEIKGIPEETEINEALAHKPQAVIISNPTALHLDVAIPAAQAGCSILLEKPVSHNMKRIAEFQSALMQGGGQVLVGFQFRFHPGLRQVKKWLIEEKVGKIVSCQSHWGEYLPAWHPWENFRKAYSARADLGGGVVNTLSHPLDYQRWLFGEVRSLWAYTSSQSGLELEVEDTAEIGMNFENGVLSSTHLNYVQRPPEHTLKIVGSAGTITWDNADGIARLYLVETNQWQASVLPTNFERNTLFMDEMKHFLNVVNGIETPMCTLDDGIQDIRVAEAVHLSAREGRMVDINGRLEQ